MGGDGARLSKSQLRKWSDVGGGRRERGDGARLSKSQLRKWSDVGGGRREGLNASFPANCPFVAVRPLAVGW
jgi:hypothetical protein